MKVWLLVCIFLLHCILTIPFEHKSFCFFWRNYSPQALQKALKGPEELQEGSSYCPFLSLRVIKLVITFCQLEYLREY